MHFLVDCWTNARRQMGNNNPFGADHLSLSRIWRCIQSKSEHTLQHILHAEIDSAVKWWWHEWSAADRMSQPGDVMRIVKRIIKRVEIVLHASATRAHTHGQCDKVTPSVLLLRWPSDNQSIKFVRHMDWHCLGHGDLRSGRNNCFLFTFFKCKHLYLSSFAHYVWEGCDRELNGNAAVIVRWLLLANKIMKNLNSIFVSKFDGEIDEIDESKWWWLSRIASINLLVHPNQRRCMEVASHLTWCRIRVWSSRNWWEMTRIEENESKILPQFWQR